MIKYKQSETEVKKMQELTDAAREAKREYFREWRRKNKGRVRENNRRYWERKAAQRKEENEDAEKNNRS